MRANGVRKLAVWCLGRGCNHFRVLDMSNYPDGVLVPSFGPRLRCERCGHQGADARPNWNEMYKQEPITRASSASDLTPSRRWLGAGPPMTVKRAVEMAAVPAKIWNRD